MTNLKQVPNYFGPDRNLKYLVTYSFVTFWKLLMYLRVTKVVANHGFEFSGE